MGWIFLLLQNTMASGIVSELLRTCPVICLSVSSVFHDLLWEQKNTRVDNMNTSLALENDEATIAAKPHFGLFFRNAAIHGLVVGPLRQPQVGAHGPSSKEEMKGDHQQEVSKTTSLDVVPNHFSRHLKLQIELAANKLTCPGWKEIPI